MNRELAPIVVFAYDRPEHLRRTLDALSQNDLAKDSVLYIYCDGAREWGGEKDYNSNSDDISRRRYGKMFCKKNEFDEYCSRINNVRELAKAQTGFSSVNVVLRDHNMGLAANITGAITDIIEQYGKVIAFEDDIISTRGVLTYLNDALKLYNEDTRVMHISAYVYPHKIKLPETFFHPNPYPAGGWATWARAWKYYSDNTQELVDFWKNDWKSFNIIGQDHLQKQLLLNLDGKLKTWYIKWYASMRRQNGLCLYPGISMTNNIGFDNTGETSETSTYYYINNPKEYTKVERIPITCNKKAHKMFHVRASGHWYSKRYRKLLLFKLKSFFHLI